MRALCVATQALVFVGLGRLGWCLAHQRAARAHGVRRCRALWWNPECRTAWRWRVPSDQPARFVALWFGVLVEWLGVVLAKARAGFLAVRGDLRIHVSRSRHRGDSQAIDGRTVLHVEAVLAAFSFAGVDDAGRRCVLVCVFHPLSFAGGPCLPFLRYETQVADARFGGR